MSIKDRLRRRLSFQFGGESSWASIRVLTFPSPADTPLHEAHLRLGRMGVHAYFPSRKVHAWIDEDRSRQK